MRWLVRVWTEIILIKSENFVCVCGGGGEGERSNTTSEKGIVS